MELTLNIEDLQSLVIKNEFGEKFKIVPYAEPEPYGEYLTRTDFRKKYRIGDEKITRWINEGLDVIVDGNKELFDRRDIDEFLSNKKVRI